MKHSRASGRLAELPAQTLGVLPLGYFDEVRIQGSDRDSNSFGGTI
jgi:hypothetical protein